MRPKTAKFKETLLFQHCRDLSLNVVVIQQFRENILKTFFGRHNQLMYLCIGSGDDQG